MTTEERKQLAFIGLMLFKLAVLGEHLTANEIQQLKNVLEELGAFSLDEKEFRW